MKASLDDKSCSHYKNVLVKTWDSDKQNLLSVPRCLVHCKLTKLMLDKKLVTGKWNTI